MVGFGLTFYGFMIDGFQKEAVLVHTLLTLLNTCIDILKICVAK